MSPLLHFFSQEVLTQEISLCVELLNQASDAEHPHPFFKSTSSKQVWGK